MRASDDKLVRVEVTSYRPGSEPDVESMTIAEARKLAVQRYDHLLARVSGVYGYRDAQGDWVEHPLEGSGLGHIAWEIVRSLQFNPGVFLTRKQVDKLVRGACPGDYRSFNGRLAARLKVIRSAHRENGTSPRLFVSKRNGGYAVQWPARFSWIWIDPIE
ncbi:MAG: hypothetical protein IID42_00105 [Planctomycetes bacterium]|nr:hypothetical protein [Planctomycetota bacterium]